MDAVARCSTKHAVLLSTPVSPSVPSTPVRRESDLPRPLRGRLLPVRFWEGLLGKLTLCIHTDGQGLPRQLTTP